MSGGWVSPDETCTNYEDLINNYVIGNHWLKKEFGYIPRISWQLDNFGHSNGVPRLFADLGLEAVFMSRGDAEYKE